MRGVTLPALACTIALVGLAHARQQAPPQPTFRTGLDVIQLDVSVLDKDRQPVRGLTAADFTVLEAGQARRIVAFKSVDAPAARPSPNGWMRELAGDVTTNAAATGRVVAIVMDLPIASLSFYDTTRRNTAAAIVRGLAPDDLAAVIYLLDSGRSQSFTTDHGRLLDAITQPSSKSRNFANSYSRCAGVGIQCLIDRLRDLIETLRPLDQQRKTLVYIGGFAIRPRDEHLVDVEKMLREAQRANVIIHGVDPNGLSTGCSARMLDCRRRNWITPEVEGLRTLAERTGGRAVVNHNDPDRQMPAILNESSGYYLLGFESAGTTTRDGFHAVKVTVSRPNVSVRTRSGYYDSSAVPDRASGATSAPAGSTDAAITGALPKSDVPMVVTVAPFAGTDGKAMLAIALGVAAGRNPAQANGRAALPQAPGVTEVLARVFDPEGRSFGSRRLTFRLAQGQTAVDVPYEVLPRMSVAPGKYEVRLGVRTADSRTGSVYAWADVPDFARAQLSLSGLVLSAVPGSLSWPRDAFADVLPVLPTAQRVFSPADGVTAFLRIYQGGARPPVSAFVTARVMNDTASEVATNTVQFGADAFGTARDVDYQFRLPLARLTSGEYLLQIDAVAGQRVASRTLKFKVR